MGHNNGHWGRRGHHCGHDRGNRFLCMMRLGSGNRFFGDWFVATGVWVAIFALWRAVIDERFVAFVTPLIRSKESTFIGSQGRETGGGVGVGRCGVGVVIGRGGGSGTIGVTGRIDKGAVVFVTRHMIFCHEIPELTLIIDVIVIKMFQCSNPFLEVKFSVGFLVVGFDFDSFVEIGFDVSV